MGTIGHRGRFVRLACAAAFGILTWSVPGVTNPARASTTAPSGRTDAAMAADPVSGKLVLFGGSTELADTWAFDGTNWTQVATEGPKGRHGAGMAQDGSRERLLLFGGSGNGHCDERDDTWTWDGRTQTWSEEVISPLLGTKPPKRTHPAMAYDAATDTVVLFSGVTESGCLATGDPPPGNDTWIWDGTTWERQSPPISPPARSGAVMVYDEVRGKVLLFGGFGLNDTWSWDGVAKTWTLEDPGVRPPPTWKASATYHRASEKVVLFGGLTGDDEDQVPFSDDTWTWDGRTRTWTLEHPSTRPVLRRGGAMAYHASSETAVLFGGEGWGDRGMEDTWMWTGTTWRPGIQPTLAVGDVAVVEGDTGTPWEVTSRAAVFNLTLSQPTSSPVSVSYRTTNHCNGTVNDFEGKQGTAVFPAGVTQVRITSRIRGDVERERLCFDTSRSEGFGLDLWGVQGAMLVDDRAWATIIDDDPAPLAGRRVDIGDAWVHEGDDGLRAAMFTVSLSHPSHSEVTVNYTTVGGGATSGTDFMAKAGTVRFPPGSQGAVVKVPIVPDAADEPDELFSIKLSAASGATKSRSVGNATIVDND